MSAGAFCGTFQGIAAKNMTGDIEDITCPCMDMNFILGCSVNE